MDIHAYAALGDLAALRAEIAKGVSLEAVDESGRTPLMAAVASTEAGVDTVQLLLDAGANVNAVASAEDHRGVSVLSIAAKRSSLEKIKGLVAAGADVGHVDACGYSVLLHAMHRGFSESAEERLSLIRFLISSGAPLNVESKHGESALSVSSHRGDFHQVKVFLEHGADPTPLEWTPLLFAVAFGDVRAVESLLEQGASLDRRDCWNRTPFLLSVHTGHREIARILLERGSAPSTRGHCGRTALMYAISRDDAPMLNWLIAAGWNVEETDDFGHFPLLQAAQQDAPSCVAALLAAGAARHRDEFGSRAMCGAASPEIVRLLAAAGDDLSDLGPEMRSRLVGIEPGQEIDVSEQDYHHHTGRRFGTRNPERMNNPFWEAMVRTRASAYQGAAKFGCAGFGRRDPVWCFQRFGQSITQLPDGRYVEIGGEHEDWYDPDFCIYNDVVVHQGDGAFDILGYPEQDFPPTDFHSATFRPPYIYIIGSLGYQHQRQPGETPVYRLHSETWAIEKVPSTGENPGWIHRHQAKLVGEYICIRGGTIETANDQVENKSSYVFDLANFTWRIAQEGELSDVFA